MAEYVLCYDVRAENNHDYTRLYDLLKKWSAAHLQKSVWLVVHSGSAKSIREDMKSHMHADDTICVIELGVAYPDWATSKARQEGVDWLKKRFP